MQGTIQAQIVDEEWRQPQQIEESYCFPAAIARTQHEWSRQFPPQSAAEKAGVGGSTPSLATIFSIAYKQLLKSVTGKITSLSWVQNSFALTAAMADPIEFLKVTTGQSLRSAAFEPILRYGSRSGAET